MVAIEPVPSTFEMLTRNVRANGLEERVTCVNAAVGPVDGEVQMWVTRNSGLSELASGAQEPGFVRIAPVFDDAKRRVAVASERLDTLLARSGITAGQLALVWSDAQGSEPYVIESGADLWASGVPLYLEVAPWLLDIQRGVGAFVDLVEQHFKRFLTREALVAGGEPQDIRLFCDYATGHGGIWFGDALLMQ
jgi:FkbM family methyltransferase